MNDLERISKAGIKRVKVLGPGEGNYCCAACSLLVDREFSVDNAPELPPSDCKCQGGSKIMYVGITSPETKKPEPDVAEKMQAIGCLLTLFITVPILLIFLFIIF